MLADPERDDLLYPEILHVVDARFDGLRRPDADILGTDADGDRA